MSTTLDVIINTPVKYPEVYCIPFSDHTDKPSQSRYLIDHATLQLLTYLAGKSAWGEQRKFVAEVKGILEGEVDE